MFWVAPVLADETMDQFAPFQRAMVRAPEDRKTGEIFREVEPEDLSDNLIVQLKHRHWAPQPRLV